MRERKGSKIRENVELEGKSFEICLCTKHKEHLNTGRDHDAVMSEAGIVNATAVACASDVSTFARFELSQKSTTVRQRFQHQISHVGVSEAEMLALAAKQAAQVIQISHV